MGERQRPRLAAAKAPGRATSSPVPAGPTPRLRSAYLHGRVAAVALAFGMMPGGNVSPWFQPESSVSLPAWLVLIALLLAVGGLLQLMGERFSVRH